MESTSQSTSLTGSFQCSESMAKFYFDWTIDQFEKFSKVGQMIESKTFTSSNKKSQWCLHMYPYGDNIHNKGYMSLYLVMVSCNIEYIKTNFTFSIYNNFMNDKECEKSLLKQTFHEGERFGFRRFIDRSCLSWNDTWLLRNGKLRLHCEVSIIDEPLPPTFSPADYQIVEDLNKIYKNNKFCDVTLVVNGKEFYAHKAILAARSPVFSAMFEHDMEESTKNIVKISDIFPEVFEQLLQFIYTGKIDLDKVEPDMLSAADKYCLTGLKLICEKELSCKLSLENIVQMLLFADTHSSQTLKQCCIQFIACHHASIPFCGPEWENVANRQPHLLNNILSRLSKELQKHEIPNDGHGTPKPKRKRLDISS